MQKEIDSFIFRNPFLLFCLLKQSRSKAADVVVVVATSTVVVKTAVKAPEKVIIFLKGVAPSRRVCIIMRGSFEGRKEILDIFSAIEKDSLWS